MALMARSLALFIAAGLCEIRGGYLVWQWWRNGAPWFVGAIGAVVLFLYGIVPSTSPSTSAESTRPTAASSSSFRSSGGGGSTASGQTALTFSAGPFVWPVSA